MEHVLGQDRAVGVLSAALASGRPHHAYAFHGPAGVGKFTTAVAFAQILLCPNAAPNLTGQVRACETCESCRLMASDNHPDLHIIRKELAASSSVTEIRRRKQMNIPVDLIRELIVGGTTSDGKFHNAAAYRSPLLNHGKVFIIDEAELIDMSGQNALLKTLEEPSPGTYLILVTANENGLFPTVRSRCQRIAFVPLTERIVEQWLSEHATSLDADARQWLAGFSEGSLGRTQLAMTYDLHRWARRLLPAIDGLTRGKPDADLGGDMAEMIDAFAKTWVDQHANASKEAANRRGGVLMWSMLANEVRRRIAALAPTVPTGDLFRGDQLLEPWLTVIDDLAEAQKQIDSHVNLTLVCDNLVSKLERALRPAAASRAS